MYTCDGVGHLCGHIGGGDSAVMALCVCVHVCTHVIPGYYQQEAADTALHLLLAVSKDLSSLLFLL